MKKVVERRERKMTIEEMNAKFGAPGRIVFHTGFAGYPNVVIAGKYGSAEIALLGGNVLSYRPTGIGEVVFRPAKKDYEYNRGDSFHGGIPVCWPQFGNRFSKELPQHGFARKMVFEVRGSEYSGEMTEITLGLKSNEDTLKFWPHEFDLELKITVSMKLTLTLVTKNTGKTAFDFSCGFHPYFLLKERDKVTVKGLAGCDYFNGVEGREEHQEADLKMDHATDHIFALPMAPKHEFAVIDEGLRRAIAIASSGNTKTVVWNPGTEAVMTDHTAEDWRKFVCVEPVSDWPGGGTLEVGASHELMVAIQGMMEMEEGEREEEGM